MFSDNNIREQMQKEYVAVPAVDIGATHLRIAFVSRSMKTGKICGDLDNAIVWELNVPMEDIQSRQGELADNMIKFIADAVKGEGAQTAVKREITVLRHVGVGALGGYYADGRMHPGTCPKRKELEGISLLSEIGKALGDGWKVSVNNDGMVQALISAGMLLDSKIRNKIPKEAIGRGKIMVIVPGTSIGGGGVLIRRDGRHVYPMPGPHQIWDIVLRRLKKEEAFLKKSEKDDHPSLKKAREENSFLSLDIGGTYLDTKAERLGFSNAEQMGKALLGNKEGKKKKVIEEVYRRSARDLVTVIKKMYLGEGEKAVVNEPDESKEFWDNTRKTEIFILGGWLVANHVIKDLVFSTVREGLKEEGLKNIVLVAQDDISQLRDFVVKAGVLGASLLIPEREIEDMRKKKDKEGFIADEIVPEMRSILSGGDDIDGAAEKIDALLSGVAKDPDLGAKDIPLVYALAQKNMNGEEDGRLSRVTFKIFTGITIDEYAERSFKNTSMTDIRVKEGPRIVTLTPNPALDLSADCTLHFLGTQDPNGKAFKLDAGGKGLNVSVGLKKWGIETIPMGFIGGATGKIMLRLLNDMGIATGYLTGIRQSTRINPSIHASQKGQVHLENIGPMISAEEQESLERTLLDVLREGDHLLMAGSLPRGVGDDHYGKWIEKAKKRGVNTYIDTRNVVALEYAIKEGPYFLGINVKELADYLGFNIEDFERSDEKIAAYSRSLVKKGIEKVVVSRGSKGMVMSSKDGSWLARPPEIEKISPVGAGDTIKMAFVYAYINGMTDLDALRLATAASAVSVTKTGTGLAGLDESLNKMKDVTIKRVNSKG